MFEYLICKEIGGVEEMRVGGLSDLLTEIKKALDDDNYCFWTYEIHEIKADWSLPREGSKEMKVICNHATMCVHASDRNCPHTNAHEPRMAGDYICTEPDLCNAVERDMEVMVRCTPLPKPNRVVMEMAGTAIVRVLAERPSEVVVIVLGSGGPMTFPSRKSFGGPDGLPVEQLGIKKEDK